MEKKPFPIYQKPLEAGNLINFFLLAERFPGYAEFSFEKRQAGHCRFAKENCSNPGNSLINRKKPIKVL
jgi:hypothetical protein